MNSSILLYLLMLAVVLYGTERSKNFTGLLNRLGFKKISLGREALYSTVLTGGLILASVIIMLFFYSIGMSGDAEKVTSVITQAGFLEVLLAIIAASFVEEIFFRGYLQRKTNLLFASFVFAYFHIIYGSLSEVVGAFALGLMIGYAYKRTNNLFTPIAGHLMYNLVTVSLAFAAV